MWETVLMQGGFKLALALAGIIMGRLSLVWMDQATHKSQSHFGKWITEADDQSSAIYYAGRLIFVGLIVGAAIG